MAKPSILFITLKTFSLTGGVEKVCRGIAYALQKMSNEELVSFQMISLYDNEADIRYVQKESFIGFGGKRAKGTLAAITKGLSSDILILSHINLAIIGLAVKLLRPKTKVILWAHGIEVWRPVNKVKQSLFNKLDHLIAVSRFTASETGRTHKINPEKVNVIPNALDPFFQISEINEKPQYLISKYKIKKNTPILFALTRISITEKDKNYDLVIQILGELKKEGYESYYILAGKYDQREYERIMEVAALAGVKANVILPGFIAEEEVSNHYQLADAFVLPSTKEGFGIAFVEALANGLPVVAGNKDGSNEALRDGELGVLIDPLNKQALKSALKSLIMNKKDNDHRRILQQNALRYHNYPNYLNAIKALLLEECMSQADLTFCHPTTRGGLQ